MTKADHRTLPPSPALTPTLTPTLTLTLALPPTLTLTLALPPTLTLSPPPPVAQSSKSPYSRISAIRYKNPFACTPSTTRWSYVNAMCITG